MKLHFDNKVSKYIFSGEIGLEKESLRVDKFGRLAQTAHPFKNNPHIDRDFCENQIELITVPCNSSNEVWHDHAILHKTVTTNLLYLKSGEEFLWPFSNPPYFESVDDIPIAHYDEQHKDKERYREYLSKKYGKRKMLFSGIHYNFSYAEALLKAEFEVSEFNDFNDFKNNLYLDLAQKATQYSWLIVYLMAASSVCDASVLDNKNDSALIKYASLRCCEVGYWNKFTPVLNYNSLQAYVDSIEEYIQAGMLKSAAELYYPVRLKPRGANTLDNLKEKGVNHIELRMLDLNPLTPVGIFKEDIAFLHMLLIYLSAIKTDGAFNENAQLSAIGNMKRAAEYDDNSISINFKGKTVNIRRAAIDILNDMEGFFEKHINKDYEGIIKYQKEKITNPQKRYAVQVRNQFVDNFNEKGLALTKAYAHALKCDDFI